MMKAFAVHMRFSVANFIAAYEELFVSKGNLFDVYSIVLRLVDGLICSMNSTFAVRIEFV